MTYLVLMRHAQAQPQAESDQSRPLTPRGHSDAMQAGRWLREHGLTPDAAVVSPAVRTQQTFAALGLTCVPVLSQRAYHGSAATLLELVRALPDTCRCALVVGHNPGVSELARAFGYDHMMAPAGILAVRWDAGVAQLAPTGVSIVAARD